MVEIRDIPHVPLIRPKSTSHKVNEGKDSPGHSRHSHDEESEQQENDDNDPHIDEYA
jgi:hypothetical protein